MRKCEKVGFCLTDYDQLADKPGEAETRAIDARTEFAGETTLALQADALAVAPRDRLTHSGGTPPEDIAACAEAVKSVLEPFPRPDVRRYRAHVMEYSTARAKLSAAPAGDALPAVIARAMAAAACMESGIALL